MLDNILTTIVVLACLLYVGKIGYNFFKGKNPSCGCSCSEGCSSTPPPQQCNDIKKIDPNGETNE